MSIRPAHSLLALLALAAGAGCPRPVIDLSPEDARERSQAVVYGDDDRREVYSHPDTGLREVARASVAAMIPYGAVNFQPPNDVTISAPTLAQAFGLCPDEAFASQPSGAACSGTLIDDNLILTAGHCVPDENTCHENIWAFDYHYVAEGDLENMSIAEDLYACAELMASVEQTFDDGTTLDYAIVRLDRAVAAAHAPATIHRPLEPLSVGAAVSVIGFPSGIPTKIASGGAVLDNRAGTLDYFVTNLDTFGGNSGSGVFNASRALVGILVRGEEDYVYPPNSMCARVNVLDENAGREQVTYVARALDDACSSGFDHPALCSDPNAGVCSSCSNAGDCPSGWSCLSWASAPDVTFCSPPCAGAGSCPADHTCSPIGSCFPDLVQGCVGDAVWVTDSCGNAVTLVEDCASQGRGCASGACAAAAAVGDSCAAPIVIQPQSQVRVGSVGNGYTNSADGSCDTAHVGRDLVFAFTLDAPAGLLAHATGYDTVLHLRRSCDDPSTEVACDDDSGGNVSALLDVDLEPGTYFLFLDAWGNDLGNYELNLSFTYDCGDGCLPGSRRCADNGGFQICTSDAAGCAVWGPVQGCGGLQCFDGFCQSTCSDECDVAGATLCSDPVTRASCWDNDNDGCLELVPIGTCGAAEQCEAGTCVPFCTSSCALGESQCVGPGRVAVCTETASGCFAFVEMPCGDDETCVDGRCEGSCVDACAPGAADRCRDDATVESCMPPPPDGCTYWEPTLCPLGTHCDSGECIDGCANQCSRGDSRCVDGGLLEICVDVNGDGCNEWSESIVCPGSTACSDGRCQGTCDDVCERGEGRCLEDNKVQVCTDELAPCATWTIPAPCPLGVSCAAGSCQGPCVNECSAGDGRCLAEHVYEECVVISDTCAVWSGPRFCFDGDVCLEGGRCGAPLEADGGLVVDRPEPPAPKTLRIKEPESCGSARGQTSGLAFSLLALIGVARRRRAGSR